MMLIAPFEAPLALPLPNAKQPAPAVSEAEGTDCEAAIITPSKPDSRPNRSADYAGS